MILGIGVDSVTISEVLELTKRISDGALQRLFTKQEIAAAYSACNHAEYLAARFAVKEAVFKAVAHLTKERFFDLRIVETLNHKDGSPYINMDNDLKSVLSQAGINTLHVSITTEGNLATAFVIAEIAASDEKAIQLLMERIDVGNFGQKAMTDIKVTSTLTSVVSETGCGG